MLATESLNIKLAEVRQELKRIGLWRKQAPDWVTSYDVKQVSDEKDFLEWLQFTYLPNCNSSVRVMIVPQAMRFFGEDIKKGKLLQLLIELDSLQ